MNELFLERMKKMLKDEYPAYLKKLNDKVYYNHSGFPGGIRARKLGEILAKKPEELLMLAVKRMLPKNKLGRQQLTRLRVFVGTEHSHTAQKPNKVEL